MFRLALIALFGFVPAAAFSATADFERCHAQLDEQARLTCYDLETGYSSDHAIDGKKTDASDNVSESVSQINSGRQWRLSEEKSALEERLDVWLSVASENTEGNSIGSPVRAFLWIRCMENKTNILIGFKRYTTDSQNVRYKIDDGPVQKQWMEPLRGGEGIGVWSGGRAIAFIKGMFRGKKLVVAYNTYSGPVEFTFDISGLERRIEPVYRACEWIP